MPLTDVLILGNKNITSRIFINLFLPVFFLYLVFTELKGSNIFLW